MYHRDTHKIRQVSSTWFNKCDMLFSLISLSPVSPGEDAEMCYGSEDTYSYYEFYLYYRDLSLHVTFAAVCTDSSDFSYIGNQISQYTVQQVRHAVLT